MNNISVPGQKVLLQVDRPLETEHLVRSFNMSAVGLMEIEARIKAKYTELKDCLQVLSPSTVPAYGKLRGLRGRPFITLPRELASFTHLCWSGSLTGGSKGN